MTTTMSATAQFRVGTLRYTRSTLTTLFIWLLLGNFCFQLMEMVILQVLPLKLHSLDASNTLMGIIITTIPSVMGLTLAPMVGFRSDRYRSRWGRRIPFLLWSTPPLSLFLVLLGFSDSLGHFLQKMVKSLALVSPATTVLGLIILFIMGFQAFNIVVNSVYYYLFNDVVPETVMGRFLGLFRVVASVVGSLFSFLVFRHAESHMREIFVGAGILYFVAFMLMCWRVKEGEYPPSPADVETQKSFVAVIRIYFEECFSHRFYWDFFLSQMFYAVAGCAAPFMVFLYLSANLGLAQIGIVTGWVQIGGLLLGYPCGALSDRMHPVRLMMISTVLLLMSSACGLVWIFIHPTPRTAMVVFAGCSMFYMLVTTLYAACNVPMSMRVLPKIQYGQFCSANSMVGALAVIIATPVLGLLLDVMKRVYQGNSYYYRFAPVWIVFFQTLSLWFLYRVYRYWKRHGAEKFDPPKIIVRDGAASAHGLIEKSPAVATIPEGSIS